MVRPARVLSPFSASLSSSLSPGTRQCSGWQAKATWPGASPSSLGFTQRLLVLRTTQGCLIPLTVNEQAKCSASSRNLSRGCWTGADRHTLPQPCPVALKKTTAVQEGSAASSGGLGTSCSVSSSINGIRA